MCQISFPMESVLGDRTPNLSAVPDMNRWPRGFHGEVGGSRVPFSALVARARSCFHADVDDCELSTS